MLRLPMRWRSAKQARAILAGQLKDRYLLRLHTSMLFGWTVGVGYVSAKLAFAAGLYSLTARYTLTACAAYLAFLLGMRIWLALVGAMNERSDSELSPLDLVDGADITLDAVALTARGVSAGVDALGNAVGEGVSAVGEGIGDAVGEGLGAVAGEGCLPVLLIGLLVLGGALLFGLLGPELLIDIAFEALLAGSLVGAMRIGRDPDWLMMTFRKTILIFLAALVLMLAFGYYAHKHYPDARTTREVFQQMRG
ncbi:MAG: hypothetical protein V4582_02910 [Pseudomonadota bacterium]